MNFDSPFFLSIFLPLLIPVHRIVPGMRRKNVTLFLAGLLFYSFGSLTGVGILLAAITFNYLLSILLGKCARKRIVLSIGVAANLIFLGAYKYLAFFARSLLGLPALAERAGGWIVPLGISFFTFKCISYLVDTFRRPETAASDFLSFALYVSFFPQITAGPISRFPDFASQLENRNCSAANTAGGFRRFLIGLGKKLLLAAPMEEAVSAVFALPETGLSGALAWVAAIAYLLEIFFDFSAYSDMAIGLGRMFGFETAENFDYPYIAATLSDFWRRWHISLSQWFRDYLYIPLGGNRKGNLRAAVNKLIVFTLCGFWHGAAWTFLLWGLWHGIFAALETLQIIPTKRMLRTAPGRFLGHIYTLLVVCIGFVLFRAPDLAAAWNMLKAMLCFPIGSPEAALLLRRILSLRFAAAACLCAALCLPLEKKLAALEQDRPWLTAVSYGFCILVLVLSLCAMAALGFQPFIYAQF